MESTVTPHPHDKYIDQYIQILYAQEGCPICLNQLYMDHHKLVARYCSKNYPNLNVLEQDELISECYRFFLDSVRKFDIDKGHKFSTFLTANLRQISRYIIQYDTTITKPADYRQKVKKGIILNQLEESVDVILDTTDKDRLNLVPDELITYDESDSEYHPEIPVNDYIDEALANMSYSDQYSAKIYWNWGNCDMSVKVELTREYELMARITKAVKKIMQRVR